MTQSNKLADKLLMIAEAEECRDSLRLFVEKAWSNVDPSPFVGGWCLDAICDHLTALTTGQIRFLLINIPPRHTKSLICSVLWPVWSWLHIPEDKFLCASYSLNLAIRDNLKKRNLIDSRWFQERYCQSFKLVPNAQALRFLREKEFALSPHQNAKRFFLNDKLGYQMATSVGASTTGDGGSVLLCLCYNAEVTTDMGRIRIGDIVENQLHMRILAYDHNTNKTRWQMIERYEKNPGRPCVRVTLNDGRVIDATADHPFYVVGRGYIPAAQLTNTDKVITDESFLREMRKRDKPQTISTSQTKPFLLRHGLLPRLAKSASNDLYLSSMQKRIPYPSIYCKEEPSKFLQHRMLSNPSGRKEGVYAGGCGLRDMWERIQATPCGCENVRASFLQSDMSQKFGAGHLRDMRKGIRSPSKSSGKSETYLLQSGLPLCQNEQNNHTIRSQSKYDIHLRSLQQGIRAISQSRIPIQASFLQPRMSWSVGAWEKQSRVSRWETRMLLPSLRQTIRAQTITGCKQRSTILLNGLQIKISERREITALSRYIRQLCLLRKRDKDYAAKSREEEFLLSQLRQSIAQRLYQWREQPALRGWESRRGEISQRVPSSLSKNQRTGWQKVRIVSTHDRTEWKRTRRTSHRLRYLSQRTIKSGYTLSMVSRENAWQSKAEGTIKTVLVRCVEPLATPEHVYNIQIAEDHNYFANGVLVHNCDDPHSASEAHGDTERENALTWFKEVWSNRMNDASKDRMVVTGQRIHERDVSGLILKERPDWVHLNLPAEYEPSRHCFTAIGWSDPRKSAGDLLWPERFSQETLNRYKRDLGEAGFHAQYQQSPVPASGGQFKEKWFRYCSLEGDHYALETPQGIRRVLTKDCWRFTVVDIAISTKQHADWTVIQTYDVTPQNELLLIDQIRGHFDNPEQQRIIRATYFRLKPQFVQIEAVAYQLSLVQQLREEPVEIAEGDILRRYSIPIREYRPVQDKVSRASSPALLMENGKFYFLKTLPDLHVIKSEFLTFPKGANDDIVDCGSQAAYVIFTPSGPVMWSIEDAEEDRSPETAPSTGSAVSSIFEKPEYHDDEGEMFDFEFGGDSW